MRYFKHLAIAASALVVLAVGCASVRPINNVTNAPVVTNKPNVTLDEVGKTIVRAGVGLGWQMREVKPGAIVGTINLREHTAVVDIAYTTKQYSITYKDSTNLRYDGANIHNNYNGWVQNLSQRIAAALTAI